MEFKTPRARVAAALPAMNAQRDAEGGMDQAAGMAASASAAAPATRRPAGTVTPRISRRRNRSGPGQRPRIATPRAESLPPRRRSAPRGSRARWACGAARQAVDLLVEDVRSGSSPGDSSRRPARRSLVKRPAACRGPPAPHRHPPRPRRASSRSIRAGGSTRPGWPGRGRPPEASSASWASWRTPRQTRITIGPCRITSSSKAASAASSRPTRPGPGAASRASSRPPRS